MEFSPLTDKEFVKFRDLIFDLAGITLSNEKKALVSGRLQKRLRKLDLRSYSQYYDIVVSGDLAEKQIMVDLLTTNETYFYREPDHFAFVKDHIVKEFKGESRLRWLNKSDNNSGLKAVTPKLRVWSAACSSGEEVYTLAFVLAEELSEDSWEIIGSDINEDVVNKASKGVYSLERAKNIPKPILKKYCLKGVRNQEGKFMINKKLKQNIRFMRLNLLDSNKDIGFFDVIFLRNVMIYFNRDTRTKVVAHLTDRLKDNGYLIIGHSESLLGVNNSLKAFQPTVYRKATNK